ncbi:MAG TPA: bifunctional diguanylate cyclase/phosphodiesterase [Geminicoccaceae bacterium]|nr:bifunctional diguanylate cyclase/phosphodiesterase [Geminicoccus sp.]HMU48286.1 bifunctional diguanylate cyclase/phosphodiesterase [Geminicoccaceae bacterium]
MVAPPVQTRARDQPGEFDEDGLTGLGSEPSLHRAGQAALATARLAGRRMALLLVDLDRFSDVNALHGCHLGDEVLRRVARQLVGRDGACCVAARLSGDRFALLRPDLTDEVLAARWAEDLLDGLGQVFDIDGTTLQLSASAGIAVFPDHGMTVGALLRSAELALSEVKRAGGGRSRVFCKRMDASLKARKSLERELRLALDNGDFRLHYQPQIDLRTGRIGGVEGLLRWPHRSQGMIPPAKFIPLAESCGLIRPLGAWVMAEACRAGRRWHDLGLPIEIAVNLSAAQLRHQELVTLVGRTLIDTGLPAHALELELTESLFVDPSELHLRRALERVAEMGVRLAIDDFGTGYSSLAYLKRLPFNKIKIDRSFLVDIGNERVDEAIVRAIIGLAKTFGKLVLAEGVETEAQRQFLLREDCDAAQGYLFSRPVAEEAVTTLLQADAARHRAPAAPIARAS